MSAIVDADVLFKRSVVAAAGNTTAQADPNASLGDQVSTTQWTGGSINDLFDDTTGLEAAAGDIEYRCIFIHNSNASNPLENVVIWISAETALGGSVALAADSTAASAVGSGSAQALAVANEDTAPAGPLTFTSPTTQGAGVSLGTIPSGQVKAFWIRRTVTAGAAALSADGATISYYGETGSL